MRIRDLLDVRSIRLDGVANDKADVLNQMVELMSKSGKINDVETYRKGVFAREEEGTTGIGEGIAIPHCKSKAVSKPGLAAMVVPDGVEYEALDGAPVNLLFLIAAPDTKENVHLDVLSKLSVLLMNKDFTNGLKNAKSVEEFMTVIDRFENEKDEETVEKNNGYDVVAVTACPTGIAHTYMAAETLEKKVASGGIGHQIYTHLMNGVSHMLPLVIGGGILIALAFLVDTIMGYGTSGGGNFGTCTPLSAFLKYVGGLAMGLMVPVLAGYIAESIADRPGLAVGFAGGMVPPVGIALACKLFPKKFTKDEKNSWVSNLIMGASFITEGAIPFAAADPAHVIPCTLVGAGVAGCLTAVFKCTLCLDLLKKTQNN